MFTKNGQASRVSIIKEIAIGATMGAALGFWWQTYHWSEAKKVRPAPILLLPAAAGCCCHFVAGNCSARHWGWGTCVPQ